MEKRYGIIFPILLLVLPIVANATIPLSDWKKGYSQGYIDGKTDKATGEETDVDDVTEYCHTVTAEWCNGWKIGYADGYGSNIIVWDNNTSTVR